MTAGPLAPILTPHGHLLLAPDRDAPALAEPLQRRLTESFARGAGHGLLQLGASEVGTVCRRCSATGALWAELDAAFRAELQQSKLSLQDFLKRLHPAWNLVGRVHFNLAENREIQVRVTYSLD